MMDVMRKTKFNKPFISPKKDCDKDEGNFKTEASFTQQK